VAAVLHIIDAFGIDRCMWGTDWTRTSGKAKLMGGSLAKIYRW